MNIFNTAYWINSVLSCLFFFCKFFNVTEFVLHEHIYYVFFPSVHSNVFFLRYGIGLHISALHMCGG